MFRLLEHILSFGWRREGAILAELHIKGSRVWFADFAPHQEARKRQAPGPPLNGARSRRSPRGRRPPTLILVHGLGGSSASFYPVISHLRRGYRVVVLDLPGYGRSSPPAGRQFLAFSELVEVVETFVTRVAPGGAYLAGNSMGGWIATKVAARRPKLARGIALLNPGGPALQPDDWADFAQVVLGQAGPVDQLFSRLFHRPPFGVQLFARDFQRILRGPAVVELLLSLTPQDFLSDEEMAMVRCPAVLIWGEHDRFIPEGCRSFFLEKLQGVRYEPVPDCGHCPQIESPRRTAQVLLELPGLSA